MSKIAVIYKSKYGSTKQYAKWIADELNANLFDLTSINVKDLLEYDVIILGGGLYAGGIIGSSLISKNFDELKDKNIIVFTVGLAATEDKSIFKPIIEKNFQKHMIEKIKFFHLRGGIDYSKLSIIHKPMMAMLKASVSKKKPEELTEEDKQMLDTYGNKVDFKDKDTIEPIITYVRTLIK